MRCHYYDFIKRIRENVKFVDIWKLSEYTYRSFDKFGMIVFRFIFSFRTNVMQSNLQSPGTISVLELQGKYYWHFMIQNHRFQPSDKSTYSNCSTGQAERVFFLTLFNILSFVGEFFSVYMYFLQHYVISFHSWCENRKNKNGIILFLNSCTRQP